MAKSKLLFLALSVMVIICWMVWFDPFKEMVLEVPGLLGAVVDDVKGYFYSALSCLIWGAAVLIWFLITAYLFFCVGGLFKSPVVPVLGVLIALFIALFPAYELFKIAQINGFLWGPEREIKVITDRAPLSTGDPWGEGGGLAWGPHDEGWRMGENTLYVSYERYNSVLVGDKIEIIRFPGDPFPHTPGENSVSPRRIAFYTILLIPFVFGITFLIGSIWKGK